MVNDRKTILPPPRLLSIELIVVICTSNFNGRHNLIWWGTIMVDSEKTLEEFPFEVENKPEKNFWKTNFCTDEIVEAARSL